MDQLQRWIYSLQFKVAFLQKRGTEFQDWFVRIATHAYDTDFEPVRPYGNLGDRKCDGYQISTATVFQCYAPALLKDRELIAKIDGDFSGALKHWPHLKRWVFVHNDSVSGGLPPTVVQHLHQLRQRHPIIAIETWSEPQLRHLVMNLDLAQLEDLFGPAPSLNTLQQVGFADLAPVIDALAKIEPGEDMTINPPSPTKLEKNRLSPDAAGILQQGRRKQSLVEDFLGRTAQPDIGEGIAEAFRQRYKELKALNLEPDEIFGYLHQFAGLQGDPRRQAAVFAVMSYFFHTCDIFEDPSDEAAP